MSSVARGMRLSALVGVLAVAAGCTGGDGAPDTPAAAATAALPALAPVPPTSIAFGVFGDAPYYPDEVERYEQVLADVRAARVDWLLHVGDLFWYPCSDALLALRHRELSSLGLPVVYTPGDNEWTDCHEARQGRHDPLERLQALRRVFFTTPTRSLGAPGMPLASQGGAHPENARWSRGRVVFATIHIVGSANAGQRFRARTRAHDAESRARLDAGIAWLREAFATARRDSARAVVIAVHANLGIALDEAPRRAYAPFVSALAEETSAFPGEVLLIHGDSHTHRVDHPLRDAGGKVLGNFTRAETYGSPLIGWVRVTVDTVAGKFMAFEPRLVK